MRFALVSIALIGLAACSGQEPVPEGETQVEPNASFTDDAATDPDIVNGEIPARYLGVWDYVGGTCAPESDMRMEIAPRSITFYESLGMVAGVGQDGGDAIADLVMEGEGETWINVLRLSLVEEDGQTLLHTSDGTGPKVKDEYPRKKCN